MTRLLSDILEELDTAATAMLRVPSAFVEIDCLIKLRADIIIAIERPAEAERVIDFIDQGLVEVLLRLADRPSDRARLVRVARALHLEVQQDLRRAREEELRQMRSEATR